MSEFIRCETEPWTLPFNMLRMHMDQLNPMIFKRVLKEGMTDLAPVPGNAKVHMTYTAYWEGEQTPFDSSELRNKNMDINADIDINIMEALDVIVRTMHFGENAQFLVSNQLLFQENAVLPSHIQADADALFIVKVMSYYTLDETLDYEEKSSTPPSTRNEVVRKELFKSCDIRQKEASVTFDYAVKLYYQGEFRSALRMFGKTKRIAEKCMLVNSGAETKQQLGLLIPIIINMTFCCILLRDPLRTLSLCEELQLLMTDMEIPIYIQYIRSYCFLQLHDLINSEYYMIKVLRLLPRYTEIINLFLRLNNPELTDNDSSANESDDEESFESNDDE